MATWPHQDSDVTTFHSQWVLRQLLAATMSLPATDVTQSIHLQTGQRIPGHRQISREWSITSMLEYSYMAIFEEQPCLNIAMLCNDVTTTPAPYFIQLIKASVAVIHLVLLSALVVSAGSFFLLDDLVVGGIIIDVIYYSKGLFGGFLFFKQTTLGSYFQVTSWFFFVNKYRYFVTLLIHMGGGAVSGALL